MKYFEERAKARVCAHVRANLERVYPIPKQGLFNYRCFFNAVQWANDNGGEVVECIYIDVEQPILHYLNTDGDGYLETTRRYLAPEYEYYKIRTVPQCDYPWIHRVFSENLDHWKNTTCNWFERLFVDRVVRPKRGGTVVSKQNMKEFSYEAYERGEKVITRCGYPVLEILKFNDVRVPRPLMVLVNVNDSLKVVHCTLEGRGRAGIGTNGCDLFMAPVKKKGYINLYMGREGVFAGGSIHSSRDEAKSKPAVSEPGYVATATIEWEE